MIEIENSEVRQSLHCNIKNCNHCLLCVGEDPMGLGTYMCEKFGTKAVHGLILAKFCDMFMCSEPTDDEKCKECRGNNYFYDEE